MLELLSEDILCHVAAVDGWNPSLIASMASVSRHMTAMARCHVWRAYCYWRSDDVTRELMEVGESSGGKGEKEREMCEKETVKESDAESDMEKESRNEMEKEIEWERQREEERQEERERERGEPPGGWIALARLLSFCPGGPIVDDVLRLRMGRRPIFDDAEKCHVENGSSLKRVKEGEGLLFNSSDVIFQSEFCEHKQHPGIRYNHDTHTYVRGAIKGFGKSIIRQTLFEQIRSEGHFAEENDCNDGADSSSKVKCPFCFSRVWDVHEVMERNENYRGMRSRFKGPGVAILCPKGHFYCGFTQVDTTTLEDYDLDDDWDDDVGYELEDDDDRDVCLFDDLRYPDWGD